MRAAEMYGTGQHRCKSIGGRRDTRSDTPDCRNHSYYLDAFEKVRIEKPDKTLRDLVCEQDFEYVHEVQHFLRRRYGSDDLKINYTIIPRNRKASID